MRRCHFIDLYSIPNCKGSQISFGANENFYILQELIRYSDAILDTIFKSLSQNANEKYLKELHAIN